MDFIYNYKILISGSISLLFVFIYYKYSELKIVNNQNSDTKNLDNNIKKIKDESLYLFIFVFVSLLISLYSTDSYNNDVMNHIKQGEPPF
jgi:predicted RND superfamily exporter protein